MAISHKVQILCPEVPKNLQLQGAVRHKQGERDSGVYISLSSLDNDQVEAIIAEWGDKFRKAHIDAKQNVKKDGDFL